MTTLTMEPASRTGLGNRYVLKDRDAVVATAHTYRLRSGLEISIPGRQLVVRAQRRPKGYVVIDDTTGQRALDLIYTRFKKQGEAACVTLSSGARLYWTLRLHDRDRMTGFYDEAGTQVVAVRREDVWRPGHSFWENLWRTVLFDGLPTKYFQAEIADAAAARLARKEELFALVVLGAWLDRTQNSRLSARAPATGTY